MLHARGAGESSLAGRKGGREGGWVGIFAYSFEHIVARGRNERFFSATIFLLSFFSFSFPLFNDTAAGFHLG